MSERAHRRAAACFELARSTPFAAERKAAIDRGKAIVAAARLDLTSFDVPGEPRARYSWIRSVHIERSGALTPEDLSRIKAALDGAEVRAGARPGETAYDARRRNFDAECRAARARDAAREAGRQ